RCPTFAHPGREQRPNPFRTEVPKKPGDSTGQIRPTGRELESILDESNRGPSPDAYGRPYRGQTNSDSCVSADFHKHGYQNFPGSSRRVATLNNSTTSGVLKNLRAEDCKPRVV